MTRESTEQVVVQTSDLDEAITTMRATLGDVDFRRSDGESTEFAMHFVRTSTIATARWSMTGTCTGNRDEDDESEETFLTGLRLGGAARVWSRWNDMDENRPFVYPDRLDSVLDGPDVANLAISRAVVREHARAATGVDDLEVRFTGTAPVDPSFDRVWRDTMAYTSRTMLSLAERTDIDVAQAGLVDVVASLMLRTFPSTALDASACPETSQPVTATRRAVGFIDDNLAGAITVPEIARAARLSTRGLYAAFRRDLGTTPMEYLRAGRLAAARQELLAADPATTSITDVALRWGFPQEHRFVESYLASHGEAPEATLLR